MLSGKHLVAVLLLLVLGLGVMPGCAARKTGSAPAATTGAPASTAQKAEDDESSPVISDPLEPWNRFWFGFNDVFYMKLLRPITKGYAYVVPKYARDHLECAYQNFLTPVRMANAVLQLRPDKFSRELGRFIVNSTFGLGGLYDLAATNPDMAPQQLDLGQTLGVWGMGHGFYLVWPLIGPASVRDSFGMAGDVAVMPTTYVNVPIVLSLGISGAGRFNRLPESLTIYEELKRSAIEPYVAARDAYVQLRARLVREALRGSLFEEMH